MLQSSLGRGYLREVFLWFPCVVLFPVVAHPLDFVFQYALIRRISAPLAHPSLRYRPELGAHVYDLVIYYLLNDIAGPSRQFGDRACDWSQLYTSSSSVPSSGSSLLSASPSSLTFFLRWWGIASTTDSSSEASIAAMHRYASQRYSVSRLKV